MGEVSTFADLNTVVVKCDTLRFETRVAADNYSLASTLKMDAQVLEFSNKSLPVMQVTHDHIYTLMVMSFHLGMNGYSKDRYPATSALHTLAMSLAKLLPQRKYNQFRQEYLVYAVQAEHEACDCANGSATDPGDCDNSCGCANEWGCCGMCGNECDCWKWVCGTCCNVPFCYGRDLCCRTCSNNFWEEVTWCYFGAGAITVSDCESGFPGLSECLRDCEGGDDMLGDIDDKPNDC